MRAGFLVGLIVAFASVTEVRAAQDLRERTFSSTGVGRFAEGKPSDNSADEMIFTSVKEGEDAQQGVFAPDVSTGYENKPNTFSSAYQGVFAPEPEPEEDVDEIGRLQRQVRAASIIAVAAVVLCVLTTLGNCCMNGFKLGGDQAATNREAKEIVAENRR